ncbi:MAG: aminoacyl-tRNA hydrolase [Sphaerochaeta sp.]|jgi:PTH1 family peptidyl-tRNA hydrolase|nr:aminoacyl-tRNA hydrolase [Sphaerochaeta sp.]MCI2096370.1 aminoacyl-tRNA hydrolase [Sphaerochaeta sp.]MCI2104228.1 aminoacyl-tRNA hydrolase [Sphaerochaeta sp.]MCI2128023.1 aminoacyl-tRNA hydrolase [Sphaerochaeta sp.]
MNLIVFLGNPGKEYARTRHNVGFRLADVLFPDASWQKKFHGLYAQEAGQRLLKPQTYMNISGQSVAEAYAFFHLHSQEVVVVHDDLELPFGTAKLQLGGGLQGHNGLRSIKTDIGSDQFLRIRIGIGRPPHGNAASYVLAPFTPDEEIGLSLLLPRLRPWLERPQEQPQEISLE